MRTAPRKERAERSGSGRLRRQAVAWGDNEFGQIAVPDPPNGVRAREDPWKVLRHTDPAGFVGALACNLGWLV